MNAYLVVLRHSMEDLPVALFATEEEATECADGLDWMPSDDVRYRWDTDCSTPVCICIVKFVDGMLQGKLEVRWHDDP